MKELGFTSLNTTEVSQKDEASCKHTTKDAQKATQCAFDEIDISHNAFERLIKRLSNCPNTIDRSDMI